MRGAWARGVAIAVIACMPACSARARHPFFARAGGLAPGPIVFAHRGGGGLLPEETLPTLLAAAARDPAAVLEFDVHRSRDGHIILLHDDTVDRTTNGHGPVSDLSLAELQGLDAGYCATPGEGDGTAPEGTCPKDGAPAAPGRFPFRGQGQHIATLDEVLGAVPPDRFVAIEVKQAGFEAEFAATVRAKVRLDRLVTGSEDDDIAARLKDLLPEAAHYLPRAAATCLALAAKATLGYPCSEDYDIFASPLSGAMLALDTPGLLDAAHARGIGVVYWTINDEPTLAQLAHLGADGVFSDYPDRARQVNTAVFGASK